MNGDSSVFVEATKWEERLDEPTRRTDVDTHTHTTLRRIRLLYLHYDAKLIIARLIPQAQSRPTT